MLWHHDGIKKCIDKLEGVIETAVELRTRPPKKSRMKVLQSIRPLEVPAVKSDAFSWVDIVELHDKYLHIPATHPVPMRWRVVFHPVASPLLSLVLHPHPVCGASRDPGDRDNYQRRGRSKGGLASSSQLSTQEKFEMVKYKEGL